MRQHCGYILQHNEEKKKLLQGVPTIDCKEIIKITKDKKIRESLFTFLRSNADLTLI